MFSGALGYTPYRPFSAAPAPAPQGPVPISTYCRTLSTSPAPPPRYSTRKRPEVKYFPDTEYEPTDSETECLPVKRVRTVSRKTKPRPQNKIFPFLSLPAELRNRIYEECLPDPTKEGAGGEAEFWFYFRQRKLRRLIALMSPVDSSQHHESDSDAETTSINPGPKRLGLNMLAVCKQIYNEMAPMLYRKRLVFLDPGALVSFATHLSPRTAQLLRHIEICEWSMMRERSMRGYMAIAMLAAKNVTKLEVLKINCSVGSFYPKGRKGRDVDSRQMSVPERIARTLYRDCHPWLEAVGTATGDYLKGVDVLQLQGEKNYPDYRGDPEEALALTKKELGKLVIKSTWVARW